MANRLTRGCRSIHGSGEQRKAFQSGDATLNFLARSITAASQFALASECVMFVISPQKLQVSVSALFYISASKLGFGVVVICTGSSPVYADVQFRLCTDVGHQAFFRVYGEGGHVQAFRSPLSDESLSSAAPRPKTTLLGRCCSSLILRFPSSELWSESLR
jgi:hypothetical protein